MVRHPQPLPSSRNRNRVTFKTRLRVHYGDHQADAGIVDEDEEKTRSQQRVLGVDQEDANEHHLQQVLLEAAASTSCSNAPPTAFIPTPDSTGIVDNYDKLYPVKRYKDPAGYVSSSRTVEESCNGGLAHGICYYMDEKDKEWVDRINEEARGEGTSTHTPSRTSARSAKAKGKETEPCQPVQISEDEFELVMGLFELITYQETEYLHHSLQSGMMFPEFSNYQDVFTSPLKPNLFAIFDVPVWVPQPAQMLRIAQLIYPYWKQRRMDRGGHRIIPILNGDEADTLNESYVCFRQREVKAVRKTRASQSNPLEKLATLQKQLTEPLEIARKLLEREKLKWTLVEQNFFVWKRRVDLVNLKRTNPSLGSLADEEVLLDRERPPTKKSESRSRASHSHHKRESSSLAPSIRPEPILRPSQRAAIVATETELSIQRQKESDQDWENTIDNPYVSPSLPVASRMFKFVHPLGASSWPKSPALESSYPSSPQSSYAVRLRVGRGGRRMVDRRSAYSSTVPSHRARPHLSVVDEDSEEKVAQLEERWRFDTDDAPLATREGSEEQDRILVDDFDAKYLRHSMCILAEVDSVMLTDPAISRVTSDGKKETIIPFKFGREITSTNIVPPNRSSHPNSVSTQQLLSSPAYASLRKTTSFRQPSTPLPAPTTTTNGSGRAAMNMPHIESVKMEAVVEGHHPLLSHAQLKTAFASVELAKALRPQWSASPIQSTDSPLRKPTPTGTPAAATQTY